MAVPGSSLISTTPNTLPSTTLPASSITAKTANEHVNPNTGATSSAARTAARSSASTPSSSTVSTSASSSSTGNSNTANRATRPFAASSTAASSSTTSSASSSSNSSSSTQQNSKASEVPTTAATTQPKPKDPNALLQSCIQNKREQLFKLMQPINKDKGRENCPHVAYRLDTELRRMHIKRETAIPEPNPVPTENPKVMVRFQRDKQTHTILQLSTHKPDPNNINLIDRCDTETRSRTLIDLATHNKETNEKLVLVIESENPETQKTWGIEYRTNKIGLFLALQALPRRASDGTTQGYLLFEHQNGLKAHIANFFVDNVDNGNVVYILDAQPAKLMVEHDPRSATLCNYLYGFKDDFIFVPTIDKHELSLAPEKPLQMNYQNLLPPINLDEFFQAITRGDIPTINKLAIKEPKLLEWHQGGNTGFCLAIRLGNMSVIEAIHRLADRLKIPVFHTPTLFMIAIQTNHPAALNHVLTYCPELSPESKTIQESFIQALYAAMKIINTSSKRVEFSTIIHTNIERSTFKDKINADLFKYYMEESKLEKEKLQDQQAFQKAMREENIEQLKALFKKNSDLIRHQYLKKYRFIENNKPVHYGAIGWAMKMSKVKVIHWILTGIYKAASLLWLALAIQTDKIESIKAVLTSASFFISSVPDKKIFLIDLMSRITAIEQAILPSSQKKVIIDLILNAIEKSPNKDLLAPLDVALRRILMLPKNSNPKPNTTTAVAQPATAASSSSSGSSAAIAPSSASSSNMPYPHSIPPYPPLRLSDEPPPSFYSNLPTLPPLPPLQPYVPAPSPIPTRNDGNAAAKSKPGTSAKQSSSNASSSTAASTSNGSSASASQINTSSDGMSSSVSTKSSITKKRTGTSTNPSQKKKKQKTATSPASPDTAASTSTNPSPTSSATSNTAKSPSGNEVLLESDGSPTSASASNLQASKSHATNGFMPHFQSTNAQSINGYAKANGTETFDESPSIEVTQATETEPDNIAIFNAGAEHETLEPYASHESNASQNSTDAPRPSAFGTPSY